MKLSVTFQIKDKGGDALMERLRAMDNNLEAVAGWPERTPGMTKVEGSGASPGEYMKYNNDGVKKKDGMGWQIPPRPFMQYAWSNYANHHYVMARRGAERIMEGRATQRRVMSEIALSMRNAIVKTVYGAPWAENAESTIAKKGSSRPLVDTNHAMQTLAWEIRPKQDTGGET